MAQQLQEPSVVVQGDVSSQSTSYAREKLLAIIAHCPMPVLGAELRLVHNADPARSRPNHVEMAIDLNGARVRARRSARTMTEAIDRTVARLRRRIDAESDRPQSLQLRHRDETSWHHDDRPTERTEYYPRPVEEREIIRRKTFALEPESIDEALFDLESLDHDFFLFVHDETNSEAVVYRTGHGYAIAQRTPTMNAIGRAGVPLYVGRAPATRTLPDALRILDDTNATFEFFVDADTGHGAVAYRRYDGHYGVIVTR